MGNRGGFPFPAAGVKPCAGFSLREACGDPCTRYQEKDAVAAPVRRFFGVVRMTKKKKKKKGKDGVRSAMCGEVAGFQNIEDVGEVGVGDVALVGEAAMFHHAAGRSVVREGEGDDSMRCIVSKPCFSAAH